MLPYKPLNFDPAFLLELKTAVLAVVEDNPTLNAIRVDRYSESLQLQIDQQLHSNGLPPMRSSIVFNNTDTRSADPTLAHIDGNGVTFTHVSVIVPISGCDRTAVCWFKGNYIPIPAKVRTADGNSIHWNVLWRTQGTVSHALEIVDTPYICKVDIPHDDYTNRIEPKIVCTFRLAGNPFFEQLVTA